MRRVILAIGLTLALLGCDGSPILPGAAAAEVVADHSGPTHRGYTITRAVAPNGNTATVRTSRLLFGHAAGWSGGNADDYTRAAQRAMGSDWVPWSLSSCGSTTCRVGMYLSPERSGESTPLLTTVDVRRTRFPWRGK